MKTSHTTQSTPEPATPAAAEVPIHTDFITLGQLLKLAGIVDSGGEVKTFLAETSIQVNGEHDNRRGRKIYPGDTVAVEGHPPVQIIAVPEADR